MTAMWLIYSWENGKWVFYGWTGARDSVEPWRRQLSREGKCTAVELCSFRCYINRRFSKDPEVRKVYSG